MVVGISCRSCTHARVCVRVRVCVCVCEWGDKGSGRGRKWRKGETEKPAIIIPLSLVLNSLSSLLWWWLNQLTPYCGTQARAMLLKLQIIKIWGVFAVLCNFQC